MDDAEYCSRIPFLVATTQARNDGLYKNIHYVVSHFGFFLFNAINVVSILIFHGILLKSWSRNLLVRIGFFACLFQSLSCLCSITRYAKMDEYGDWAHISNWVSLIAYSFYNITIWHVILNRRRTDSLIWIGSIVWIGIAVLFGVVTDAFWETKDFTYIRGFFVLSTVHQVFAYASFWWELRKGTIRLPDYFPCSKDFVSGTMIVSIGLAVIALILGASGWILFQYPATGMTFTVMVVVVSMVGEIDFKQQSRGDSTSGEQQPLTA